MARRQSTHPTDLELEILKIIWRDGASNARHVCDKLAPTHNLAFTSVCTVMGIMVRKGYLSVQRRRISDGGNLYMASVGQAKTASQMLHLLSRRLFGSSITGAIQHLVRVGEIKRSELTELRKLLDEEHPEGKK